MERIVISINLNDVPSFGDAVEAIEVYRHLFLY